MVATLEDLRERETALKEKERLLADEFRGVPQDANFAKKRDAIRGELAKVSDELIHLSPEIAAAKEGRKQQRLVELLASPAYRTAVAGGLEALAATLTPWLPLLRMTIEATRSGVTLPLPPATIATVYVEGKAWVETLIRRGIVAPGDVPLPLRSLLEG